MVSTSVCKFAEWTEGKGGLLAEAVRLVNFMIKASPVK